MITLPWLTKTMEFEALHPRRRGGQFGKKPTNNGPSLFDRDAGGGWKPAEKFVNADSASEPEEKLSVTSERKETPKTSSGKRMSYAKTVEENLKQMGTPAHEWAAVPVTGMTETENSKGSIVSMPVFDFPSGYDKAPSMFRHDDNCCHLCGHDIKNVFWIQNDDKKWVMPVGSECVTNFGEGDSGDKAAKKAIHAANRDFVRQIEDAARRLFVANSEERDAYEMRGGMRVHIGTKREWIRKHDRPASVHRQIKELMKNISSKKGSWNQETGKHDPEKYVSSDREVSNWVKKNKEAVSELLKRIDEIMGTESVAEKTLHLPWLTKKLGDIRGDSIKQSRGGVRAHWHDYAKKANIDPDELHTIAAEYKHHHDEAAGEKHNMLKRAREFSVKNGYGSLNNLRRRNATGDLDPGLLRGFDEIAEDAKNNYPHLFKDDNAGHGDSLDQLFEMLTRDENPQEMDWEDAYKFAANHIDSKPEREPGSDEDVSDAEEFGLGSDNNDFEFGANEKPDTTPKEEVDPHADAKKLEAKLAKKNPNGFTGIKRNQGFIHGTKVDSDTYDRHRALEKSREPAPEPTKAPAQVQPQQAAPMPANQPNAATAPKQPGATNDFTGWNGTAYMIQGRVVDQATYHAYAEQKKQQAKNQNQATTPAAGRDNPDLEAAFGAPSSGHAQQPTQPAAARPNNDLDDVFNDNTKKTKRTPVSDLKTAVDSVERELETAKKTGHVENIKKHSKKLGEVIEKYRSMGNAELEKRVLEKYGDTPKSRQFADKAKASFGKSLDERKAKVLGAGGSGKGKPQAKPQTGQSKQTQVSANVNNGPEFHENNRALHAILQGHDDDLKKQGMDWEERSKVLRGISDAYKNHYEDLQKSNPTGGKENFNQAMRAKYDLKKGLIPEGGNAQATQTPQKNRLRDVVEAAKKDPKAFYESQKAGYIADGMGERDAHRQALNNMHMHGIPGGVPIDRKLRGALDENKPAASTPKPSGIGLGADAFNQMVGGGGAPAQQQKPQPQQAPTPQVKPTGNLPHHKTQANVLNAANEYARNAKNPDHDARESAFKKARSALKDHHAAGIAHLDSLQTGGNRRQIAKAKKAFTDRMRAIESKLGALGGFQARVKTQTPAPAMPVKQNQTAAPTKPVEPPPINPQYGRSRDQHKLTQQHLHERQKQSMRDLQDKHDQQLEALQRRLSGRGGPRLNTRGGLLGLAAGMMAGDNRAKNRRLIEQLKDKQANIEAKLAKRHKVQRQQMANRHKLRISQIPTTKKGLMEWLTPSVEPVAVVGRLPWMVKAIYDENLHPRDDHGRFISKGDIEAAQGNHEVADALRKRVSDPEQRKLLESQLGAGGEKKKGDGKKADITETPAFKAWFGDWGNDPANSSVVVDEDGSPKENYGTARKVYHGTTANFEAFDKDKASDTSAVGQGFYFAENHKVAENFADFGKKSDSQRGKVLEVFLNIRNPFTFDMVFSPKTVSDVFIPIAKRVSPEAFDKSSAFGKYAEDDISEGIKNKTKNGYLSGADVWEILRRAVDTRNVNAIIKKAGYDGLMHEAKDYAGSPAKHGEEAKFGRVWVAFEPTQIKSVDNEGTFDPKDDRIHKALHLPWLTKNAAFEALHPRANDGKFSRENEVAKLVKDAVGVQPMTQARAKEGGEIGPNGEWYRGGSFIATTDLPKKIKKKLEQSAKGKVNVEPGQKWEVPEPGKMSIIDKLGGTVLNHRDGEVNYQFLAYQQRPPEYIAMVEEVVQKWKDGQRWIDVSEYPLLANHTDIARLVVAGMPVPSEAMDKMPPDVKAHFERYKAKTEQPFPPVPNRG